MSLDEVVSLLPAIKIRGIEKHRMDVIVYHSKPDDVLRELDRLESGSERKDTFNDSSFERLKNAMAKGRAIEVK